MKINGDMVTFSTGKIKSANCGVIGLSPKLEVTEGFDAAFHRPMPSWMTIDNYDGLTRSERIELANYMIEQWQRFKVIAEQEIGNG